MTAIDPDDELLDVVDADDRVIGQQRRSAAYTAGRSDFRVVNAFLEDSNGRLLIPRRTPAKRLFPSCLDVSVGGHVVSGEGYETALRRELAEELRLDLDSLAWELLGALTPRDGVSAFMRVYRIYADATPAYNADDFSTALWLTPLELLERIAAGEPAKDDLPRLVRRFC